MSKWKELALELATMGKEISRQIVQLEAENAALKRENEALREGIRDVREYIPPIMEARDMLLALLHPDTLLADTKEQDEQS